MKKALIIVGHGSRSKVAQEIFEQVIEMVIDKSNNDYEEITGASMSINSPNINQSIESLLVRGFKSIHIIPYFLYSGVHVRKTLPKIIRDISTRYPKIQFKLGKSIGTDPLIADILLKRAKSIK